MDIAVRAEDEATLLGPLAPRQPSLCRERGGAADGDHHDVDREYREGAEALSSSPTAAATPR